MVIQKFNKLIRNKWLWGAFAAVISAAFCFEGCFTSDERRPERGDAAGRLGGEEVKAADFTTVADDIRGFGRNRDWRRKTSEVNRTAWETLAALEVADRNGIAATDTEVAATIRRDRSFAANGQFSFSLYQRLLAENGVRPERFEAFLKRRLTVGRVAETMMETATWVSPSEQARALADMTDTFTVKVARFTQSAADAAKIKLDEAGLKKWYEANTNSLALPERVKLRMVKFDATKADVQKKMVVTEDDMRDYYDTTIDKYTSKGTNGVEVVKKFEEVKGEIEKELRLKAAVQYFETNVNFRAYAGKPAKGVSRLDTIAKEDGLTVTVSDWFAPAGGYVEGFMKSAWAIAPGAKGLADAVAELDPSSEDLRYAVIASDKAVWLVEKAETSPAHVPTFEEAKTAIRPRALRDAQAEQFKAEVEAIAKKGAAAVLATKNVSTNITFAICDLTSNQFNDQHAIAGAVRRLSKGGVSEFTRTGMGSGLLVVCENRVAGDAAKTALLGSQVRDTASMPAMRALPDLWQKWNLERLGFEPNDLSTVADVAEED
jgi:hypothetical protein